jgi:hypothetical protein
MNFLTTIVNSFDLKTCIVGLAIFNQILRKVTDQLTTSQLFSFRIQLKS